MDDEIGFCPSLSKSIRVKWPDLKENVAFCKGFSYEKSFLSISNVGKAFQLFQIRILIQ
jgi:hypothetical protein